MGGLGSFHSFAHFFLSAWNTADSHVCSAIFVWTTFYLLYTAWRLLLHVRLDMQAKSIGESWILDTSWDESYDHKKLPKSHVVNFSKPLIPFSLSQVQKGGFFLVECSRGKMFVLCHLVIIYVHPCSLVPVPHYYHLVVEGRALSFDCFTTPAHSGKFVLR